MPPLVPTLEARLLQWYSAESRDWFKPVETLVEAHGIRFLCPKDYQKNNGNIGTHSVIVYFTGSPVPSHLGKNKNGETVRWQVSGTGLSDLTLKPSILEEDSLCGWHGFVTNGIAE